MSDIDDLLDAHETAARDAECYRWNPNRDGERDAKRDLSIARAAIVARVATIDSANRDERAAWSRCYALLTGDSGAYTLADLERTVGLISGWKAVVHAAVEEQPDMSPDSLVYRAVEAAWPGNARR